MRSWRTALRIARREARRARGRAILVIAMIAVPVAALAFAAVNYDTFDLSPAEQADRRMGSAQAAVSWPFDAAVHQDSNSTELFATSILVPPPGTRPAEPTMDRMLALLPAGSRAIADQRGRLSMQTATGIGNIPARMLAYADPLAHGILRQVSGRAPATVDEVALTRAARQRLGAGVGDTVRLADSGRTFRVVGIVEEPNDLKATTIVLRPGALPADQLSQSRNDLVWLVDTPGPVTWTAVKELNRHGLLAVSRHVLAHQPSQAQRYPEEFNGDSDDKTAVVLVAGLAMLEIVLLAGPAFAVGARRRQRDLALVAAAGGTPAHVRRIVLADGVVLGAAAAAAGVALGVLVAAAGRPLLEEYVQHKRSGALSFYPLALAVLGGLALVTGVLAALVPAWISSRQDVVTALSGRRGITRSRRRWIVAGGVLAACGIAVATAGGVGSNATLIVAGLAIGELGLVLCTPSVVGLVSRAGRWLPVAARIALRDASRNRTAAAPAVSAVMAAVIGSLAVAVIAVSSDQRNHDDYAAAGPLGTVLLQSNEGGGKGSAAGALSQQELATVRSNLPVTQFHQVSMAWCDEPCRITPKMPAALQCPYSSSVLDRDPTPAEQRAARRDSRCDGVGGRYSYFSVVGFSDMATFVVDPATAGAVFEVPQSDVEQVAAALRSGSVVVDDPRYVDNGRVTLTVRTGRDTAREVTAPGFAMPHRLRTSLALMTEQTAASLGLKASPLATLASTSRMPTVAEQDRLQAALGNGFFVYVERGPGSGNAGLLVLAIVAGVIALAAAAIATGLAAADGRADLTTLAAVGASPRLRRALSLSQSGVIAGLGSLIGAVAGVGASTAILAALNRANASVWPEPTPYPIIVPWSNVAIAVLVVPAVAMLGAGLLTRSRLPIERRL
jgi:putative ABC transport system permease protein